MKEKIQELREQLDLARSPREAKEILDLLAEVEQRFRKMEREKQEQKKLEENQLPKHRQKRQQQKEEQQKLLKEQEKLNDFSSGSVTWKHRNRSFYPTWDGYVHKQHMFIIEQKLSKYELKIVEKDTFGKTFQEVQKKAEDIMDKHIKNINAYLLETKKRNDSSTTNKSSRKNSPKT